MPATLDHPTPYRTATARLPLWWRVLVIASGTLILCSCRSSAPPLPSIHGAAAAPPATNSESEAALDEGHYIQPPQAGVSYADPNVVPAAYQQPAEGPAPLPRAPLPPGPLPAPEQVTQPWAPPGIVRPWPRDEYLYDGGDRGLPARVTQDWIVHGLEMEDTVAHFDTLDGRTIVQPSNQVPIYAPRFAAVRSVTGMVEGNQVAQVDHMHQPLEAVPYVRRQQVADHLGGMPAYADIGSKRTTALERELATGRVSAHQMVAGFDSGFLPYEDLSIIRFGIFQQAQGARLAVGRNAAITWTHDLGVQAVVNGMKPAEISGDRRVQATYQFEDPRGPAKLRLIKVASLEAAKPGDVIDFTLRYDNVGGQEMGNVTIIDNLTTRLEFVPGSEQSDREARFLTQRNDGSSLVLRWEITDPLPAGEGGIIRFKCRVR